MSHSKNGSGEYEIAVKHIVVFVQICYNIGVLEAVI